jgi:hypothetical protein
MVLGSLVGALILGELRHQQNLNDPTSTYGHLPIGVYQIITFFLCGFTLHRSTCSSTSDSYTLPSMLISFPSGSF